MKASGDMRMRRSRGCWLLAKQPRERKPTYQLESLSASCLDQVGNYCLERREECAEKSNDEAPGCEVIIAVSAVGQPDDPAHILRTYAKPTPATTGRSETSFIIEKRVRRRSVEIIMVNKGVDARTTWWNFRSANVTHARVQQTYRYSNQLERDVADRDVDGV
jgi:hypothetical protein